PGKLYQPEFAWWKDSMFGTVKEHLLFQVIKKLLSVLGFVHIDKIDNHNSSHITQAKLSCSFLSGLHIDHQRILILILRIGCTITAIDIDNVQSFSMLNHQVRSARQ